MVSDIVSGRSWDRGRQGERVPPGQRVVQNWPVLTYGRTPQIDLANWRLRIFGAVAEVAFGWEEISALPRTKVHCDMHCVTSWSRLDNDFEGVALRELFSQLKPSPAAEHVIVHSYGGYTTNVSLADLTAENVLLAYGHDGKALAVEHGGPARLLIPHLYLWKSAKWVSGLEFLESEQPGFWEMYGYHMRGDPWKEQRYS